MSSDTLKRHIERFISTKHNAETQTWYEKCLRPMLEYLGPDRQISSVTREDAEDYWLWLQRRRTCWDNHPNKPTQRRKLSPATLSNHLRAARSLWNHLVRQRLIEFNPFDHLSAPKDGRPVQMKAVSPEDLKAIWKAAEESGKRDYAIVTVIATCGLRAGEVVSMDTQRLDLKQGVAWVNGKRGWRKIFLGKASIEAIDEYLRDRPVNAPTALWLNRRGQPLTHDGVRQMVDRMAKKAGVRGRHNLHSFRHRTAQAWLDKGVNAEVVSQALGHADVSITLGIYGNQDEKRVRKAMQEMELSPFDEN